MAKENLETDENTEAMQSIAASLDDLFNNINVGGERRTGFVLLTFPIDRPGTVNYVANVADRDAVIEALRSIIVRLSTPKDRPDGQPLN